ncbi:hypothetical protein [Microbacterium jejuense]|uniref:hypothetical protein n=1 Tax=Microbacterium jejuense TaxID=1263637 RepID=UPI0031EE8068
MPWFKVDDGFHGHPKVMGLSLEAVGLWALTGSWCAKYLTDGKVPEKTIRRLGGGPDLAGELYDAGLWEATPDGWQFKDWADYQPTKEEVEAERAAARDRMKKVRASKKGVRSSEQLENVDGTSPEVRIAPTQSQSLSHPDSPSNEGESARKRATRIPDPFLLTADMKAWAVTEVPHVDVTHATKQFVDYWRAASGRTATKKDWLAAWRYWLRNERGAQPVKQSKAAANAAEYRRLFGDGSEGSVPVIDAGIST